MRGTNMAEIARGLELAILNNEIQKEQCVWGWVISDYDSTTARDMIKLNTDCLWCSKLYDAQSDCPHYTSLSEMLGYD